MNIMWYSILYLQAKFHLTEWFTSRNRSIAVLFRALKGHLLRWIFEKSGLLSEKFRIFFCSECRMVRSARSLLRLLISFMILIVDILSFCWNSKKIRAKSFFGIGDMLTLGGWGSSAGDHRPQTSGDQIYCFTCLPDFCWSDFVEIWGFK